MSNATKNIKTTIGGYDVDIDYSEENPRATVSYGSFSSSWEVVEDFGGVETYGGVKTMDKGVYAAIEAWLEDQGYFA